jgi:hypothetical protein
MVGYKWLNTSNELIPPVLRNLSKSIAALLVVLAERHDMLQPLLLFLE